MEFSIVMFTSSGLLVRYLKVIEKSGYRYILSQLALTKVLLNGSSISLRRGEGVMKSAFEDGFVTIINNILPTRTG
jgi:hypothetical protein